MYGKIFTKPDKLRNSMNNIMRIMACHQESSSFLLLLFSITNHFSCKTTTFSPIHEKK